MKDVIYLSVNKSWNENKSSKELYEATNFAWGIAKKKVEDNSIKYAFSIFNNQIIEVYEIEKWVPARERIPKIRDIDPNNETIDKKFAFDGKVADNDIRDIFIGRKVKPIGQKGFTYKDFENLCREISIIYPDEIKDNNLYEGTKKQITVNAYERNSQAREKCIQHYGYKCQICEFDFEKVYGDIGKKFIHVHHIIDISTIGKNYKINPIKDLIPVCPNCHAMLHKRKPAYSPEEIKNQILT